jgi:hypothetical protein
VDEDELARLLEALEQGLIRTTLSSLVDQERITAAEGTIEELSEDQVTSLRREWSVHPGRAPSLNVGDIRIRPLSTGERLARLLDLLEIAIGGSYAIETRLRDEIKVDLDADADGWTGQIIFAGLVTTQPRVTADDQWDLPDQSVLEEREPAVRQVILMIDRLRELAGVARSPRLAAVVPPDPERVTREPMPGDWS